MINQLLDKTNSEQEKLEICQVVKFLNLHDENLIIKYKSESPDFIIENDNKIIGLEHVTIRNIEVVSKIGSVRDLIKKSEKYFIENYPDCTTPFKDKHPTCPNMIVNFEFNEDLFSFKKPEVTNLTIQIAKYIAGLIKGVDIEKPHYLSKVSIHPQTKVDFTVLTDINKREILETQTLKKIIEKKEALVKSYREKSGIQEQWLLLVAGLLNRDSYEIKKDFNRVKSDFDKVFLLDDFEGKYQTLK